MSVLITHRGSLEGAVGFNHVQYLKVSTKMVTESHRATQLSDYCASGLRRIEHDPLSPAKGGEDCPTLPNPIVHLLL